MTPFALRSLSKNCLLVTAGAVAGSVATLAIQHGRQISQPFSDVAVSTSEARKSPTRESALNRRAGDPSLKIKQILSADDREHKAGDLRQVGREAAEASPADALNLGNEIPGENDRLLYMRGVFEAWGRVDPKAAVAFAQSNFSAGAMQSESLRTVLAQWGATDPRAAYQWAEENLSGPLKEEGINSLVQSWARHDPQQAADWFVQTGSTAQPLLTAIIAPWADKSPKDAARWVETLQDPGNRDTGRVIAAREWATQNPAEAADHYATAVAEPPPAGSTKAPGVDLATVLSDIWGTSNPAAAAAWVQKLPEGPARQEAAGTLATVWAASDINSAVEWSNTLTDPDLRAAVVQHLGTTWGAIEPDKAIAWLNTQPPAVARDGLKGAYNSWAGTDPGGLGEWIGSQSASPQMDLARQSLGDVFAANDPAAALDLALGMSSADAQAAASARYFNHWRKIDAAGATEWLQAQAASLPATVQSRLGQFQSPPAGR